MLPQAIYGKDETSTALHGSIKDRTYILKATFACGINLDANLGGGGRGGEQGDVELVHTVLDYDVHLVS